MVKKKKKNLDEIIYNLIVDSIKQIINNNVSSNLTNSISKVDEIIVSHHFLGNGVIHRNNILIDGSTRLLRIYRKYFEVSDIGCEIFSKLESLIINYKTLTKKEQ